MICGIEGSILCLKRCDGFCFVAIKCKSGISFSLKISFKTAEEIENKAEVYLFTEFLLRENSAELFGFFKKEEKEAFKVLMGVSGVGPSFAISILSSLSVVELFRSISYKDCDRLCECKGIGKKTANRIILELKDKSKFFEIKDSENIPEKDIEKEVVVREAVEALVALGYKKVDAYEAVMLQKGERKVESLIKNALLSLSEK